MDNQPLSHKPDRRPDTHYEGEQAIDLPTPLSSIEQASRDLQVVLREDTATVMEGIFKSLAVLEERISPALSDPDPPQDASDPAYIPPETPAILCQLEGAYRQHVHEGATTILRLYALRDAIRTIANRVQL